MFFAPCTSLGGSPRYRLAECLDSVLLQCIAVQEELVHTSAVDTFIAHPSPTAPTPTPPISIPLTPTPSDFDKCSAPRRDGFDDDDENTKSCNALSSEDLLTDGSRPSAIVSDPKANPTPIPTATTPTHPTPKRNRRSKRGGRKLDSMINAAG